MELLSQFSLNPLRIYKTSKKKNKGIAKFPSKLNISYLDYSIDFSRLLQEDEQIIAGTVTVNGVGLSIEAVICNHQYLTAFIDGGLANNAYFLSFIAQTNLGGELTQNMVLSITGRQVVKKEEYSFLAFNKEVKPPDKKPPFNAVKIDGRFLISENGLFYRL